MRHERVTLPAATQRPARTGGWDTVSCVRIDRINEAIRNAGTTPEGFEADIGDGAGVSGRFAPWEIAPGGDGPLINLAVPLRDVTIRNGGEEARVEELTAVIQVRLELIPSGRMTAGPGAASERLLVIAHGPSGLLTAHDGAPRAAVLLGTEPQRPVESIMMRAVLKRGLEEWLNENLARFHHVFAAVNVAEMAQAEGEGAAFAWLRPTSVAYAFGASDRDPDSSVLAILAQTEGRTADGLLHQADVGLVPPGCDAGLCISRGRFLRSMIGPALPAAFEGLERRHLRYRLSGEGLSVAGPVALRSVEHEGKTYDPELSRLEVRLRDTEIELSSTTRTKAALGATSVCSITAAYAFGLVTRKDGAPTIGVAETRHLQNDSVETTHGAAVTRAILMVLSVVAGLVVTVMSAGTASTAYYVAVALLVGATGGSAAMRIAEMVADGDGPPVDLLMAEAATTVRWSTGARFEPTFAALNRSLQIGGTFRAGAPLRAGAGDAPAEAGPAFQSAFQSEFAPVMAARAGR